ncbi:MAG: PPC domain-containing protein [Spirochaetaceae bacterium]|nr:PPC domain-containing protein [Spirochaetaceae bacterium]
MMKKIIAVTVLVLAAGLCFGQQARVAVAPFTATSGNAVSDAETIAEIFGLELQAKNVVRVYTRGNIAAVMNENKFQISDLSSDEKTASIGKAANADWVVRGQVQKLGTVIVVTASLLDVNTLEIKGGAPMYLNAIEEAATKMDSFITTITQRITGNTGGRTVHEDSVIIQGQGVANSPITATINGPWITRNLSAGHTEDWFRITASSTALLVMETGGDLDTYIELYDPAMNLLMENDDSNGDHNAKVIYYSERNQTCLVKVRGYHSDITGSYQFHVAIDTDRYEPNNSMNAAAVISIGTPITANISPPGDTDWYRVSIPSGGREFIAYTDIMGDLDPKLYLYDSRGTLLAEDDDTGSGRNAYIQKVLNPGTVYLRVENIGDPHGQYVLNTDMQDPIPPDNFENDNTWSEAKDIQVGSRQRHTFTTANDIDAARLRITQAGTYDIRGEAAAGVLDTSLQLYDNNETFIGYDDDSGGDLNARISAWLNPGTYYIWVYCSSSEPLGNRRQYTLSVSRMQEPLPPDSFENDDTLSEANYTWVGNPRIHTFTNAADVDWVRFDIYEAGTFDIRSVAAVKSLDTYLELYDDNGTLINEDDDSGEEWDACISTWLNPGTYYIRVSCLDGDPLTNHRHYTLSINER